MIVFMMLLAFGFIAVGIVAIVYLVALSPSRQRRKRRAAQRSKIDLFTGAAKAAPAGEKAENAGAAAG